MLLTERRHGVRALRRTVRHRSIPGVRDLTSVPRQCRGAPDRDRRRIQQSTSALRVLAPQHTDHVNPFLNAHFEPWTYRAHVSGCVLLSPCTFCSNTVGPGAT
jgi:hypothetical protein